MINFPDWVEKPGRQSKQQLAQKRLRFLMCNAALRHGGRGSIAAFADAIGLERSTLNEYAKKGKLSQSSATKAEKVFGTDLIRAEWLVDPLAIKGA